MYNAMNIHQRPYMANAQGYKTEDESERKAQDSLQEETNRRQDNSQAPQTIARGRAAQFAQDEQDPQERPMVRTKGKPVAMGVRPRQLPPRPTRPNQMPQQPQGYPQANPQAGQRLKAPMGNPIQRPQQPINQRPAQQFPPQAQAQPQMQGAQQAQAPNAQVNNMMRNNKVNIAQIIKDFRGTMGAIGTPKCIADEIEEYLNKVVEHTHGESPSINFVQTNLLNGATILDKYISDTLEKESRVVQNWLDALFLQRINYNYNDTEINEDFLVKIPKDEPAPVQNTVVEPIEQEVEQQSVIPDYEPVVETPQTQAPIQQPIRHTVPIQPPKQPVAAPIQKPTQTVAAPPKPKKPSYTIIPENTELKALFVQAKKHAFANNPAKALNILEKALRRAESVKDEDAQSRISYEMGKIYDDNNYLAQALSNYNKSLQVTTDIDIKTKAHYSMAKIYDDVNQFDSAIKHYLNSVSYAGKEDNLSSQSKSLTNIANIFTDQYNPEAFTYYDQAEILVTQTNDSEMKGFVSSNTAGAFNKFNLPEKALRCYATAVRNYTDARQNNNVAENYKAAGELMYDLKNPAKAKVLLKKALSHTNKYADIELINQINDLLEEIG